MTIKSSHSRLIVFMLIILYFLPWAIAIGAGENLNHTQVSTTPKTNYQIFLYLAQEQANCLKDYGRLERDEIDEDFTRFGQILFRNYECARGSSTYEQCRQCLQFTNENPTPNRCQETCGTHQPCSVKCLDLVRRMEESFKSLNDVNPEEVEIHSDGTLLTPPQVLCEDMSLPSAKTLFHTVVLKWSVNISSETSNNSSTTTPLIFVIQRMNVNATIPMWETLGMTQRVVRSINSPYLTMNYRYRVTAVGPNGPVVRTASESIKTLNGWTKAAPPVRIYEIDRVVHDNLIHILVGWEQPQDKPCNFKVVLSPASGDGKSVMHRIFATDSENPFQVWFYDLKFNKSYDVGITSRRGSWSGYESALRSKMFTMPTCSVAHSQRLYKCGIIKIQNITALLINTTVIRIQWEVPQYQAFRDPWYISAIRGYRIQVQELSEEGWPVHTWLPLYIQNSSFREYILTDLKPDARYAVELTAITGNENDEASDKVSFRTRSQSWQPDIRFEVVTSGGSAAVELQWTQPGLTFGDVQGYKLKYGPTTDSLSEILLEGDQVVQHKFEKLEMGVTYEFKISARNDFGYSSEAVQFYATPEEIPSGPPTNISVKFQTADVAIISWHPPVPEFRNGQIILYHVTLHGGSGDLLEKNVTQKKAVFWALKNNQDYWVQISASTNQGSGPKSERHAFKTANEMTSAPTNVHAMATSNSTVEVWWTGVSQESRLIGYQIFYSTTQNEDLDTWQNSTVEVTESAMLVNLEQNENYTLLICARIKSGLGRISEKVVVEIVPNQVPTQLKVEDVSANGFMLKWLKPLQHNPVEYKISYDFLKEYADSNGIIQTQYFKSKEHKLSADKEFLLVKNLVPFTTYNVNVTAVPSDRSYRPPAKITVRTQMAAPSHLAKPDFCIENGNVNLYLQHGSEEYGPISHYYLIGVPDLKHFKEKCPDSFVIENMAEISVTQIKVVLVSGEHYSVEPEEEDGLFSPYVIARFAPNSIPRQFTLGDGINYAGFDNNQLKNNTRFRVFMRAVVKASQKYLYTSSQFSETISLNTTEADV